MSTLGPGPEFDRIRAITEVLGPRAAELGDDCAMVPLNGGFLALSTDVSVDGVHFRRSWLSAREIGWRATAAALSDLAAVGADPAGLLVALTLPADLPEADLLALMDGAGAAASASGTPVLGGDLAHGGTLQLAVTVVGSTPSWRGRSGAQAGDGLWVTGWLGGSRAALRAWEAGTTPDPAAREAFARPVPRLATGRWLASAGARAMIDLSDGLAGDARHLAAASGVAITIELARVPCHPALAAMAPAAAARFAAEGGEDYELLVAMPRAFGAEDASRCEAETGVRLTRIGQVGEGEGAVLLEGGEPAVLRSFDHFR